jgi:DNA polymerase IV
MSKHDGASSSENPNARTIEILQEMANYYERHQDHWRFTAYRKAIGALRKQTGNITTAWEASKIPSIGERLADKIEEIVWTDRLRRLENTTSEPIDEAFQLFVKIYGVGLKQATQWIDQGYRTIADLVANASLTKNQKIGIEHFEDFQTRIPRHEMDCHDKYVRESCSNIDASVNFTIGGSYRRGAADSGDVDFVVTKPDCSIDMLRTIVLKTLIPQLFKMGYLKIGLATTDEESGSTWHGAAALPGDQVWRRIDFLLVPWQEIGAALIYFTGNDIFNRSIRLLAHKQGMCLNQRGLWKDVIRDRNRKKITQGVLVESKDERKIFEILGVPWRPPQHRIC